jgi:hypothetical protein
MTGVLTNLNAIWAHARGVIPAVAAQMLTVRNSSAPASERLAAGISLMVKTALPLVFACVVSPEMIQFRFALDRSWAETCSAHLNLLANVSSVNPELDKQFDQDCRDL